MSPVFIKFLRYVSTIILLGIFGFFVARYRDELNAVRDISLTQFACIFILVLCSVTVNGSKLNRLTRFFHLHLKPSEWFGLSCLTTTLNNIFFKAGSLVTSNYLKRKHDFPYMSFLGSLAADQLILFFMSGLMGCAIFFSLLDTGTTHMLSLAWIYLAFTLLLFLAARFAPQMRDRNHTLLNALVQAVNALNQILQNRSLFLTLCLHNTTLIILTSLRFYVACQVLQLDVPLVYCFLFTTVMIFVSGVPLFQSDIGSREMAVGFLAELVGIGFNEGLLATLLDRVFVFFLTLIPTLFFKNRVIPAHPKLKKA